MAQEASGDDARAVPRVIRFEAFELDTRSGELRKHGIKIRLHQQPFLVLLMLLKKPGEVVLREDIRKVLWPGDAVVEFDHGTNAAVQRLRDALGDDADNPHYVETLPRRGYRFLATVEAIESAVAESGQPRIETTPELLLPPANGKDSTGRAAEGLTLQKRNRRIAVGFALVVLGAPWDGGRADTHTRRSQRSSNDYHSVTVLSRARDSRRTARLSLRHRGTDSRSISTPRNRQDRNPVR